LRLSRITGEIDSRGSLAAALEVEVDRAARFEAGFFAAVVFLFAAVKFSLFTRVEAEPFADLAVEGFGCFFATIVFIETVMKLVDLWRVMRHSLGTRPEVWAACEEGETAMQMQVYGNELQNGAHGAPFVLNDAVMASIMKHALDENPTTTHTARKGSMLAEAQAAVLRGEAPAPLKFKSAANPSYQKHADALYQLACEGALDALTAYALSGTNTYARALRKYRDLLVTAVQGAFNAGALPPGHNA
jgi:hypothetical protein